jgi:acyl-coenzyme A thioesterase PaaI-like protein
MTPTSPTDDAFADHIYDQVCFACGDRNGHGLHMRFERDGENAVRCTYLPKPEDQGFPGVLHGGVLAALLDESMAWAMWAWDRALGVTAKMETRYRGPARLDGPLVIRARVESVRGRRVEVRAHVEDAQAVTIAEASAVFMRFSPDEELRMAVEMGRTPPDASRAEG